MKRTCRNRMTSCIMMGLLVVGLTVWFALPARAVPISYTLEGGAAVGGIIFDNTLINPYIAADITFQGVEYNLAFANPPLVNIIDNTCVGGCALAIDLSFDIFMQFTNSFNPLISNPYHIAVTIENEGVCTTTPNPCSITTDNGILHANNVPELPPGVLVLIGLLVLASARWWTHRQERLQLG